MHELKPVFNGTDVIKFFLWNCLDALSKQTVSSLMDCWAGIGWLASFKHVMHEENRILFDYFHSPHPSYVSIASVLSKKHKKHDNFDIVNLGYDFLYRLWLTS
jgi:hypothetical protein